MSSVETRRDWPVESLARVPYWVYQDEGVYREELRRIFEGPTWSYVCLESDVPRPGDYRTTFVGEMPVIVARVSAVPIRTVSASPLSSGVSCSQNTRARNVCAATGAAAAEIMSPRCRKNS